ncbi:MAG: hypothetical protein WC778_11105 [Negativicutes bacterium]|jgi:hypothetical protein
MEPRNFQAGAAASPPTAPASPSVGYATNGNPSTATPATQPGAFWFHKIGEELRAAIVAGGISPSDTDLGQLAKTKQLHFIALTASGNFTTPANITTSTVFEITLVGAGAGGGGSNGTSTVGGGGGAGAAAKFLISGLAPSTAYAVLIGAFGAGGVNTGGNGGTGGTTQITINGVVYSCTGGTAGNGTTTANVNIAAGQGALSSTITALASYTAILQQSSAPGFGNSPLFSGSNGAGLPFGTTGAAGRTGFGPDLVTGFGVGGGGGVGLSMAGTAGAPGLFEARWVA